MLFSSIHYIAGTDTQIYRSVHTTEVWRTDGGMEDRQYMAFYGEFNQLVT